MRKLALSPGLLTAFTVLIAVGPIGVMESTAQEDSCGDSLFENEFASFTVYANWLAAGSFESTAISLSGVCGGSTLAGGDFSAQETVASALIDFPSVAEDLFGEIDLVTGYGQVEATPVRLNESHNPDPVTGRPRVAGATGSCGLPTGPSNSFYPDADCLRPGARHSERLPNDTPGLNPGFETVETIPGSSRYTTSNTRYGYAPVNGIPYTVGSSWRGDPTPSCSEYGEGGSYQWWCLCGEILFDQDYLMQTFGGVVFPEGYTPGESRCVEFFQDYGTNDAYLEDPEDPRNQYADPGNNLYAGDLFRAGAPACGPPAAAGTCVPSLYIPQLDPNNTTGVVAADDEYRDDAIYSASGGDPARPESRAFYDALCEASLDLTVENTIETKLGDTLGRMRSSILQFVRSGSGPGYDPRSAEAASLFEYLAQDEFCPSMAPFVLPVGAPEVNFDDLSSSERLAFYEDLTDCVFDVYGALVAEDWFEDIRQSSPTGADACLLNVFSSSNKLPSGPQELSAILSLYFYGDTGINIVAGPNITGGSAPLTLLWRDQWQLNAPQYIVTDPDTGLPYPAITPETPAGSPFARELQDPEMAGCFNPFISNSPYTGTVGVVTGSGRICDYDDPGFASELRNYYSNDLHSTLNATLSPEQEALLGCGPYFGTNCDQNGMSVFDADATTLLQTATSFARNPDWRSDGLAAGEKAMVTGSLQPCVDDPGDCDIVGGFETVTDIGSPYFGLRADDIPLLFQGWKDNCSTWLGRTDSSRFDGGGAVNGGWNCVKRYGQPGTIGARHIGEGTVETVNALYATFVPDADFQNFEINDSESRCTTEHLGGSEDQLLPGCRRKWASYRGDYLFLADGGGTPIEPRANLNLYGRDRDCMEAAEPGSLDDCTFVNNPTLRKGEVLGLYASPRVDPRSWDVTRDGDPDNAGFDNRLLVDLTPSQINFHPAILYRTGHYCAAPDGWNGVTGTSQCDAANHFGSQRDATMAAAGATAANPLFPGARRGQLYDCFFCPNLPTDVFDPANTLKSIWYSNQCNNDQVLPATGSAFDPRTGQGLPQCAQFQRNFVGGVYANETNFPVYAQGVGHPFTGQPWSNEMAAFSWNFLTWLVATSAEFQDLKIPRRIEEILPKNPFPVTEFPQTYRQPLAYATFDPNDPDNADVIAQIRALEALSPNEDRFDALQALRQELKPICSFVTPGHCSLVQVVLGYAPQAATGSNSEFGRRSWAWESGAVYQVDYASGYFTGAETVYATFPSPAPEESGVDHQLSLVIAIPIREPNLCTGDDTSGDTDGDGTCDDMDNCPSDANSGQSDLDGDLIGDVCDLDRDGDLFPNESDAFPDDPTEASDNDGDGIGNNADPDDDNDGFTDAQEAEAETDPLDAESTPGIDYGLVAHYPFSGNANDASGNENDGVVHGATLTADRFGNQDSAYSFDGSSAYVSVDTEFSGYGNFSYSAWILVGSGGIANDTQSIIQTANGVLSYTQASGELDLGIIEDRLGGTTGLPFTGYSYSVPIGGLASGWFQLVFIGRSDNTATLYLNGAEVNTGQRLVDTGGNGLYPETNIGVIYDTRFDSHTHFFSGSVDDVRIWNRALRPEEVEDVLHAEQEIDASEAFASNLFGLEQVTIVNPLEIEIPESAEGPLEGRLASFEVEVMPSHGRYLGVWPTVGAAGSGADIEVGDALGAGTPGEWELTFLPGETDATRLVYRVSPVAGSAPVVPGTLLWVAPDAIIIEALDQLLSQPGAELVLEIDFVEPGGEPLLKWVDAKIATSISGVEATGSHSVSDVAGDAGTPGYLEYISDPISLTPAGVCSGFPDGGLFFLSRSCSEDDEFQFDPINDTVHVRVGGGSLASLLEGPGSSVSIHEGSGCDPSTELAWTDTLEPDGYSQSAFLSFAPPEASQVIFAVCLRRGSETFPMPQEVPIFMWVEFGSIFLLPSEQEVARFTIEPRCFGDLNGDYLVNNLDALAFRDCFGCSGPDCNRKCDYDLDGQVNNSDALAFRNTFGDVCEPPSISPYPYISEEMMAFGTSPAGITLLAAMSASLMALVAPVRRRRREE